MSAFIISESCAAFILALLDSKLDIYIQGDGEYSELYSGAESAKEVMAEWLEANTLAYTVRYAHHDSDPIATLDGAAAQSVLDVAALDIRPAMGPHSFDAELACQYLKALQCLRYQCSEGPCSAELHPTNYKEINRKLELAQEKMDKLEARVMRVIVHKMPSYEAAPWG